MRKTVVACVNSPTSVTISGDRSALDSLGQSLQDEGIFARFLKVRTAYHSHHMDIVADDYAQSIADMEVNPVSEVEMFSTVTGALVTATNALGPEYWRKNMVSCVHFNDGLQSLCTSPPSAKRACRRAEVSVDILMEIGPHAALAGPVKQILRVPVLEKAEICYQSVLLRGQDACETTLKGAAFLFSKGLPVKLSKINNPDNIVKPQVIVDLPVYCWNHRKRHWHESRLALEHRFRRHARTDLLGYPVSDWNPIEPRWRTCLGSASNLGSRVIVFRALILPRNGLYLHGHRGDASHEGLSRVHYPGWRIGWIPPEGHQNQPCIGDSIQR